MNPYYAQVERLKVPSDCIDAMTRLSAAGTSARQARGQRLPTEKLDALIWGLVQDHPVVRRRCLELLDLHPDDSAIPRIIDCLDDPVPRVRWHAVHALACDGCKLGESYLTDEVVRRLQRVAAEDANEKVRLCAQHELESRDCAV